jgi:hypothetical protein
MVVIKKYICLSLNRKTLHRLGRNVYKGKFDTKTRGGGEGNLKRMVDETKEQVSITKNWSTFIHSIFLN